jgi:hypothetical protein
MSQDIEGDHLKLMEDTHQDMEDFIVAEASQSFSKMGIGSFTGYVVGGNACQLAV